MIYMRGQARDYDRWAQETGDDTWRWQEVLPAFMRHEDHWRLDSANTHQQLPAAFRAWHGNASLGSTGEWRVEKQRLRWDVLDAFAQAAQQAGVPATEDFNTGDNEGVGYFEVNQRRGWRWNTTRAFLNDARRRPNLAVWTHAQATQLLFTGGAGTGAPLRCMGVELLRGRGKQAALARAQVHATRSVILCAGAVSSPALLQRSGVGPADLLRGHGVPVLAALPGVGENLSDHLQIRAVFKLQNAQTLNSLANSAWGKMKIGLEYLLSRSGPMSMAPSQLGAFTRSDPSQPHANLEYHVQPLSLDAFGEPLHPFPAFTASVCNLQPSSRGSVRIQSPRFEDAPLIAPNYLSTDADRKVAADSLRVTRRIVAQPAMAKYQPAEWKPGLQHQSDEELAKLAGDIATTIFHPVGTTKMGRDDDAMAVLDARLRVRDGQGGVIAGLRVVDAGAMPSITSGNTNSPTLMMAEKAAEWILQEDWAG
jgi:choline dehydrogenase